MARPAEFLLPEGFVLEEDLEEEEEFLLPEGFVLEEARPERPADLPDIPPDPVRLTETIQPADLPDIPPDPDPDRPVDLPDIAPPNQAEQERDREIVDTVRVEMDEALNAIVFGYRSSESRFLNTLANATGLIDRSLVALDQVAGNESNKATIFREAEDILRINASVRAPDPGDEPVDLEDKILAGFAAAPGDIAQLATGAKILGPVAGFAAVEALATADQGPEEALLAGIKGAALGKIFKSVEPLTRGSKGLVLSAVGAGQAAAEGANTTDVIASGVVLGTLGVLGPKGEITLRQAIKDAIPKREVRPGTQKVIKNLDALTRAKAKIGVQVAAEESKFSIFTRARQQIADDFAAVGAFERQLTGKISELGPYVTSRLTRGAHAMVDGTFSLGRLFRLSKDSYTFRGKSLTEVLNPVRDQLDEWSLYAVGRAAGELKRQGREFRFDTEEIKAMVSLGTPAIRKAWRDFQTWNTGNVDFVQKLGLIDPQLRKLWNRVQYLPMHSVNMPKGARRISGIDGNVEVTRKLIGGKDNLNNVIDNIVQNTSRLVTEAVYNQARVEIVDFALKSPGGDAFIRRIPKDPKKTVVGKAQVEEFVSKMLGVKKGEVPKELNQTVADLTAGFEKHPDFVEFWQAQAPRADNVFAIKRKGVTEFYQAMDPTLFRAISSIHRPQRGLFIKIFGAPKRAIQTTTTMAAGFMGANIARDSLVSSIMSQNGFRFITDSFRGIRSRVQNDQIYKDFIANGGGMSSYLVNEGAVQRQLQSWLGRRGVDPEAWINTPGKYFRVMQKLVEATELGARLGEFGRAKARGISPRRAAYEGREISTDYAMRGDNAVLGFFFDTAPFFKAHMNGLDRTYRGFASQENKMQVAAKTGYLAAASIALHFINRSNPAYQALEQWERDIAWHFYIPTPSSKEPLHFMFPRIWEIGSIARAAESFGETVITGETDQFAKDVVRLTLNTFGINAIPGTLKPIAEQMRNRIFFTDRPIENFSMQGVEPAFRSNQFTSETMKFLARQTAVFDPSLQISAPRAEALLRGYTSTWGAFGLQLADAMFFDDIPDWRIEDYPLAGRFFASSPPRNTRFRTELFDMIRESTMARRTLRQMENDRTTSENEIIAFEARRKQELENFNRLDAARKRMSEIRKDMERVRQDKTLTRSERDLELDELIREQNIYSRLTVEEIRERER